MGNEIDRGCSTHESDVTCIAQCCVGNELAQTVSIMICVWKVHCSNPGRDLDCPDRSSWMISVSLSTEVAV